MVRLLWRECQPLRAGTRLPLIVRMLMLSIVYSSQASAVVSDADLAELLAQSRANNERFGLTGMLLFRGGRYLQVLEGPDDVLRERMTVIAADPRHHSVTTLLQESIEERLFPKWTMGFEPITDDAVERIPGYRSSFEDIDEVGDASTILPALRELIRWFQVRSS